MPKAENTAASFGINTLCTPVSCAAPQALIGPAPPNAAMVVSPGSSIDVRTTRRSAGNTRIPS